MSILYLYFFLSNIEPAERQKVRAHFYVYCSSCRGMGAGKLRVRCSDCSSGALTVRGDPCNWEDVLKPGRIEADCESPDCVGKTRFARFYFRCAEHISQGEHEQAVALYLIKNNIRDVPCLACTEVR
jgi:parkin